MTAVIPPEAAPSPGAGAGPSRGRAGLRHLRAAGAGPSFWLALGVLALVVLVSLLAPLLAPADPNDLDLGQTLAGPSRAHPFGADESGRDVLSRVLYGSRTSLVGPLAIVVLSTVLGVLVGLVAAWRGGWVDAVLSRMQEIVFAFPGLLVAVLVVAVLGPGLLAPVLAMAVAYVPYVGRLVRSLALAEKERPYVAAYLVAGFSSPSVALRHVLPNVAGVVLAQAVVNFGYALMDLAALSYLGLGVQPPTPDWGAMISEGQPAILEGALGPALAPGLAIVVTVVAFTVVGEGVADRVSRSDGDR